MEWYIQWIQAFAAFASRTEYPSAIAQLKQLDAHPICKNNLVSPSLLHHVTLDYNDAVTLF